MSYLSAILSAPVLTSIMLGCFIASAACMAVNYNRQIDCLRQQNERLISGVQKILAIAETMAEQKQDAK